MLAVKTTDLTKKYGKYYGIDSINLEVESGDIFGIVGPEGAGKTTLLRLLMNYIFPTIGSGSIYGNDIVDETTAIKEITGYVPRDVTCYPQMKGGKYIKTAMKMHGAKNTTLMRKLIDQFEIPKNQLFEDMDRSDTKATGIVAALAIEPKVLLLDEPTKGLDSEFTTTLFNLLIEEHEKGTTIIITAETVDELAGFCNRIAIMEEGTITEVQEQNGETYAVASEEADFNDEFLDYEECDNFDPLEDTISLDISDISDISDLEKTSQDNEISSEILPIEPILPTEELVGDAPAIDAPIVDAPTVMPAVAAASAAESLVSPVEAAYAPIKVEPEYTDASIEDFLAEPDEVPLDTKVETDIIPTIVRDSHYNTEIPKSFKVTTKSFDKKTFENLGMAVMSEEKGKIKLAYMGDVEELTTKLKEMGITQFSTEDSDLAASLGIKNNDENQSDNIVELPKIDETLDQIILEDVTKETNSSEITEKTNKGGED